MTFVRNTIIALLVVAALGYGLVESEVLSDARARVERITADGKEGTSADDARIKEQDRVMSVAVRCTYTTREEVGDRRRSVNHEGEGEYCIPQAPHSVGHGAARIYVVGVSNVRAILSVRTPQGGGYTVETSALDVKVGDAWPREVEP